MGISNKDDGTTVETSSILLAEISDFTNPNPPPVKPTFRDVVLLGWSREFPKSVLRACGLRPTGEQEGKTADANKKAWFTSLLVSLVILAAAGGMMALSMCLFFNSRFAAVWLSNAVVIGSLCSAVNWRTRVVILPAFYLINMAANAIRHKSWQICLSLPLANLLDITLITCTTLFLASLYSRKAGVELDFTIAGHVASFGISLAWTPVRAVLCAWILRTFYGPDPAVGGNFGAEVVQWLGLAPICLMAPFIISVVRSPPCLARLVPKYPCRSAIYIAILLLLGILPIAIPLSMATTYIISPTIISLFLSYPLISIATPLTGVVGMTVCLVVVGFATLLRIPFVNYENFAGRLSPEQLRQDHIFWSQICLVVLVFSSLVFNVVLSLAEQARAEIEDQVSIRTKELREARARAEEADKNKAAFIHFLCHELRNPLHAIANLTEIFIEERAEEEKIRGGVLVSAQRQSPIHSNLVDEPLANDHVIEPSSPASASIDDPQSDPDPVNAIHLCTNYMLALLSDVLDVGRFENGAVKLEIRTVDLHAVLGGVTAMAKARALAKGLQFRAEISSMVPRWVECDALRLQQVINNLLSNSFKFTPSGGTVTLAVDLQPILLPDFSNSDILVDPDKTFGSISLNSSHSMQDPAISLDGAAFVTVPMTPLRKPTNTAKPQPKPTFRLRIRCTDTGIGIQSSALATLFDPLTQAPKTSSAEYGGSGLGLSISAQIVRLMGGDLKDTSEAGKGAEFEFWVPLRTSSAPLSSSELGKIEDRVDGMEVHVTTATAIPATTPSSLSNGTIVSSDPSPPFAHPILDDPLREPPPTISRRRKILVTDDSSINRRILVRLLSVAVKKLYPRDEWIVEEAGDGMEAVDKVKVDLEGSNELELIFMDVVMPILDGYSATTRIRNLLLAHPGRKIAITVASANKVGEEEWSAAGADGAISKPFGRKEVEEVLEAYCGKSQLE